MFRHDERSIGRWSVGLFAAVAVSVLAILFVSSQARATIEYDIVWVRGEFKNIELYSSEDVAPRPTGPPFFNVNGFPIPYAIDPCSRVQYANGDECITIHSRFSSVLLKTGDNEFYFGVSIEHGDNSGVHAVEHVTLVSPVTNPQTLFSPQRHGSAFVGTRTVQLSLAQINPPLSADITRLEVAISEYRKDLVANASRIDDLGRRLTALEQLKAPLAELATRPLDEISLGDLDAILAPHAWALDRRGHAALTDFLASCKKTVATLRTEVARLYTAGAEIADRVANAVSAKTRDSGWNADDSAQYEIILSASSIAHVRLPDISVASNAFDVHNDPYAAYARSVVARLEATISGGEVIHRSEFASIVRSWRRNMEALEKANRARAGVSLKETAAFLKAQNSVSIAVLRHMDSGYWFHRTPVTPALRALVDGIVAKRFEDVADALKDHLNEWRDEQPTPRQSIVDEAIRGIATGLYADDFDDLTQYDTRPAMRAALLEAAATAKQMAAVAIVPFSWSPFVWACEAITGWPLCNNIAAQKLGLFERVVAALSVTPASVGFWRSAVQSVETASIVSAVSEKMARLPLLDRLRLRAQVGAETLAWFHEVDHEGFTAFAHAALGKANTLIREAKIVDANALNAQMVAAGQECAWVPGTKALSGTTVGGKFVRVFTEGKTDTVGSWLMLESDIRGLSPHEIKVKFSLLHLPTHIADVNIRPGYAITIGLAGANKFGLGGKLQAQLRMTKTEMKSAASWFGNARALGNKI